MNIKPLVESHISFNSFDINFELEIRNNLLLINSVSGEGKTYLFSKLSKWSADKEHIICINYQTNKGYIKELLGKVKKKLIIIDNADILLDEYDRKQIALDTNNQYIIIGRLVENLLITKENLCSVHYNEIDRKITLKYY